MRKGRTITILSIDGGGIRGVIPSMILEKMEALTDFKIWELFDLIAGTSTGGILALALTKPSGAFEAQYRAADITKMYEEQGAQIFPGAWRRLLKAKYPSSGIMGVLTEKFGDAKLSECLSNVIVTTYDIERRTPFVFRSSLAKSSEKLFDLPMVDVARSTSAAPTFFSPHFFANNASGLFSAIDGGVFANNPAMLALVEARSMLWRPGDQILLVSLGCGSLIEPYSHKRADRWWVLNWARNITGITFDGQSKSTDELLHELLNDPAQPSRQYYRFSKDLGPGIKDEIDNPEESYIRALKAVATNITTIDESGRMFAEACLRLKEIAAEKWNAESVKKGILDSDPVSVLHATGDDSLVSQLGKQYHITESIQCTPADGLRKCVFSGFKSAEHVLVLLTKRWFQVGWSKDDLEWLARLNASARDISFVWRDVDEADLKLAPPIYASMFDQRS